MTKQIKQKQQHQEQQKQHQNEASSIGFSGNIGGLDGMNNQRMLFVKRLAYICLAPLILLNQNVFIQQAEGILNCFTPNMFKMGKFQQSNPYGSAGMVPVGDRVNWYGAGGPQQQVMNYPPYSLQMAGSYGGIQNPMKMLFQPKWKGGSLFGGSKGAWNSWKMNPAVGGVRNNFYRPNPYGVSYGPMGVQSPTGSGYQFNEQLNVAPFSLPSPLNPYASGQQQQQSSVSIGGPNDGVGWSVPVNYNSQQAISQQPTNYDTSSPYNTQQYSQPLIQPNSGGVKQPPVDPYSIKGGNVANKLTTTTKNSILLANGNYGALDSYLSGLNNINNYYKNQTFGYTYPTNWLTMQPLQQQQSFIDSPAKIAQQLLKYNLKKLRLQEQLNRSAPLLEGDGDVSVILSNQNSQFTILDEPRFVGFGTVEELNNKEARLSCSFNEAIDQTNRPLWIKFLGPYNSSQIVNGKNLPPFNCANSQCRTQEIESTTKDYRYKFDNGPATSTLIISEPRLSDYGIYRCSALTKTINNNPLETIYQIIRFGSLK